MEVMLAILVGLVLYHHVVYPAVLKLASRGRPRFAPPVPSRSTLPTITVIVPAHNEARVIARKIASLDAFDYPPDKLTKAIVCDGCTDDTAAIAHHLCDGRPGWVVRDPPTRRGKIGVLNDEIFRADTDIVALSDASAMVTAGALVRAATHFADARIGVVCGTYRVGSDALLGEQAYWRYQTRLKQGEAVFGAPFGAHGAFYLFRRSLWQELPPDTINDDVMLPMKIVERGYRAVYDSDIVAIEIERTVPRAEFWRRVRIGAGNFQQAVRLIRLADPRLGGISYVFLSGKLLRAAMPLILATIVVLTALLAVLGSAVFQLLLAAEVGLGLLALILPANSILSYILLGYVASGLGTLFFLTGYGRSVWRLSSSVNRSTH